jgi:hypothetical protein
VIYSSAAGDSAPFPSAEGKRPVSLIARCPYVDRRVFRQPIHQRHYQLGCKLHLGRRHGAGFKAVGKGAHVHGGDRNASADSIGFLAAAATRRAPVTAFGGVRLTGPTTAEGDNMATKERLAAMAASLCAVCSGSMVIKLVEADPSDGASELRTYVCAECGHSGIYSVPAGNN